MNLFVTVRYLFSLACLNTLVIVCQKRLWVEMTQPRKEREILLSHHNCSLISPAAELIEKLYFLSIKPLSLAP